MTPEQRAKMPYREFLRTDYWRKVRTLVIARDGWKCVSCGQQGWESPPNPFGQVQLYDMEVNHLSYRHRGDELNHLADLELLCRDCHKRYHRPPASSSFITKPPLYPSN